MNENSTLRFNTRGDTAKGSSDTALRIDQMQCLNLRGRNVTCMQCADTCSAKALKLTVDEVSLDAGRCTACGACLPVCPSGAMWLTGFVPQQFLETVAGAAEIHIYCSQSDDPDSDIIVPCLQVLDTRLLAAAAADGAETVVLHGTDQCSSCDRGDARAVFEQIHANLKRWFTDVPVHLIQENRAQIGKGERSGEDQIQLGRRNFLRFAGAKVAHGASKWLVDAAPEQDEATSQRFIFPSDGSSGRPSAYQELLAERAESLPWRDHQLPWRSLVFSDACNACLTCAQRCPTGALVPKETKSTISILFRLRQCTDCGLCGHLCPESAISCASVASSEELRAPAHRVMHRSLRQCAGCARSFVPGPDSGELCTTCQNELDVANDWKTMLIDSS